MKRRLAIFLGLALCGTLAAMAAAVAQPIEVEKKEKEKDKPKPAGPVNEVVQEFPSGGPMQSAWKVHYATMNGYGLVIQEACFKRTGDEDWVQIIGDARLSEAFVPYHRGSPRFWDVSYNFPLCGVTKEDLGAHGVGLTPIKAKGPVVIKEVRDRGLAFKDARGARRGQTLLLWGTLSAANYRYVIEYGFQDDGTITFRCGSTGHNYGGSEWVGHMHNSYWRVDVNLDGPANNSVFLTEHVEPGGEDQRTARAQVRQIMAEGHFDFDPLKFTGLRVTNTQKKNARDKPWAYDVMVSRMGSSRHFGGDKEQCSLHDFWVTKANPKEVQYPRVHDFVKDKENVVNEDVVLWVSTPGHHEPRSEDGEMKGNRFEGVTPIMWCGFELRPRDFWDRSPYFPAAKGK